MSGKPNPQEIGELRENAARLKDLDDEAHRLRTSIDQSNKKLTGNKRGATQPRTSCSPTVGPYGRRRIGQCRLGGSHFVVSVGAGDPSRTARENTPVTFDPHNLTQHTVRASRNRARCPVVRPMNYPPYCDPDATTDYHDWKDGSGRCKFCHQTVAETKIQPPKIDTSLGALWAAIESRL